MNPSSIQQLMRVRHLVSSLGIVRPAISLCVTPQRYICHRLPPTPHKQHTLQAIKGPTQALSCHTKLYSTQDISGKIHYECLNRGFVRLHGNDVYAFLQGLTTNDMACLERDCKAMYSMVLNVQGRVMYDIIIYNISKSSDEQRYLMECDPQITTDLYNTLKKYKLRKKVKLEMCSEEYTTCAVFSKHPKDLLDTRLSDTDLLVPQQGVILVLPDPRVKTLCNRVLLNSDTKVGDVLPGIGAAPAESYTIRRYVHGIGEGIVDLPVGKCTPLESNAVFLHGVSFSKGCYIGQELTARTHHTGVIRKRLMPLVLDSPDVSIPIDSKIVGSNGKNVGRYRNSIGKYGLGLLRVADVKGKLTINLDDDDEKQTTQAETNIPYWWLLDHDETIAK